MDALTKKYLKKMIAKMKNQNLTERSLKKKKRQGLPPRTLNK